jgi:hypothetical protein
MFTPAPIAMLEFVESKITGMEFTDRRFVMAERLAVVPYNAPEMLKVF